jgi:phosphate transport system protein
MAEDTARLKDYLDLVLIARMAEDTARLKDYLDLVLIARNIERIGDHATNIAEDAVFAASAEDIRHTAPPVAS